MGGDMFSAAASSIAALLALALLAAGAAFLCRRLRPRLGTGTSAITLVATRPLGAHCSLVIAEADGKRFFLGIGHGFITNIARLDDHE
jgi:flagellar biogenesis protein FliO